jgi:hypothetical protein
VVLDEYVKNTDYATPNKGGVVKVGTSAFRNKGLYISSEGILAIHQATDTEIEGKANIYFPITPNNLDKAVKAGITNNFIDLTEDEKANAQSWLGAASTDSVDQKSQVQIITWGVDD